MKPRQSIERLGSRTLDVFSAGADLGRVFTRTIAGTFRGGRPKGEVLRQMHIIGNKSLLFVAVTLGAIGMVSIYQTCLQINRVTGELSQVGPEYAKILMHSFAATLTAMMLATRVGAGIAAEIGSMKVTEQIDALRMSGIAPINYLIVPRFIACVVMTVVLSIFGGIVAFVMGGLAAASSFDLNPEVFFDLDKARPIHLILGLTKAVCFGMAIPIISGFCGLRAQGSSEGVGWATTAAVIGSSFAVIVLDFIISALGLTFFGASL